MPRQRHRSVLERLALEQAGEQEVPLLPEREVVVQVDVVVPGQHPPGLEFHQRGGDQEEFGRHLEVELLHAGELGQVGVDDRRERDLVELDLLAHDQVQQQVERSLEDLGLHLVGHGEHRSVSQGLRVTRV
jgi:hypothetical protein